jgi:hypothetical protein
VRRRERGRESEGEEGKGRVSFGFIEYVVESKGRECRRTLPLKDHTLELVVQDEDLDADVVLRGGGELHGGHRERGVSIDVDDDLLRSGDLGSDGRRESKAHGLRRRKRTGVRLASSERVCEGDEEKEEGRKTHSKTTRRDPGSRLPPSVMLAGPHLMLTDSGGNDDVLL